ncbi:MAG: hypothetical protein ACOX0R_02375 [Candidatus Dojkabacteria bacterium]|jgi:hypothetical protein
MKEGVKLALVGMLVFHFFASLFNEAIHLPVSFLYLFIILLIVGLVLLVVCPFLNFLTVKCNFITYVLMGTIVLSGTLYILKMFMVDFAIEEFLFSELKLGTLQINEFTVTPIISIIVVSFLTSFVTAIYKELDRKQ